MRRHGDVKAVTSALTGETPCDSSTLLVQDDEFVPVDAVKVLSVLRTQPLEQLQSVLVQDVSSFAGAAEPAVPLEVVPADVQLRAGGGEVAVAEGTVAHVVMGAHLQRGRYWRHEAAAATSSASLRGRDTYLRKQERVVLQQQLEQLFLTQFLQTESLQQHSVVWRGQAVRVFARVPGKESAFSVKNQTLVLEGAPPCRFT